MTKWPFETLEDISMAAVTKKIIRAFSDPSYVVRGLQSKIGTRWQRYRYQRRLAGRRQRLDHLLNALPPLSVPAVVPGVARLHLLISNDAIPDAASTVRSAFKAIGQTLAVVVHDDGSFRDRDAARLQQLMPGATLLRRADADQRVNAVLRERGLHRLLAFRAENIYSLKMIDLILYSAGSSALYIDSDILFFQHSAALVESLMSRDANKNAYNVDVGYFQSWTSEDVQSRFGFALNPAPMNAGMFCARVDADTLSLLDELLTIPGRNHWIEQTLWYALMSKLGGVPWPDNYDVCFRYAWSESDRNVVLMNGDRGKPVVSQHYSGGGKYRDMFYEDAIRQLSDEVVAATRQ